MLPEYTLDTTNRSACEIVRQFVPHTDLAPPYQRGQVWSQDQQRALVKSWIMGIPIPAVILNDRADWRTETGDRRLVTDDTVWAVVDGLQRIDTAVAWFSGSLDIPGEWLPEHSVESSPDRTTTNYNQLTLAAQRHQARGFLLPLIEAKLPTIEAEAELYLLVNGGGTGQTSEDMQRATNVAGL